MKNLPRHSLGQWLLALVLAATVSSCVTGSIPPRHTQANVMTEITFIAQNPHADPFNDVTLDVIFHNPAGQDLRVPAFWDGSNVWKVRYSSPIVGKHTFHSECSDAKDRGLSGVTGKVIVKPYTGTNPYYLHGPVRVAADHRHLEFSDGTPFFWLGDTWWMGLSHRLHWPEDFQKLANDRKEKGFDVIQIVAGLYPDMYPFDPRGANEVGYPWETNYSSINPKYFDLTDRRLEYLADNGLAPCIVGAWGYFLPWMGVDKAKQHWRYLVARYGALPVFWCVAGEANLPWYRAKNFPYDDRKQVTGWTEVARSLRAEDPFHRLITIHPTGIGRLSARNAMDDLSLIDIDMLQTPHGTDNAVAPTVKTVRQSYEDKPVMPVIDGEAAYEMLGDSIPTEWTRQMFWLCMMNGAAGHTYGANGIWQVNRRGDPHGPSPTEGSKGYGSIAWDDAMNLPGSAQVALGKKFLQQFDWQKFQPHPEWAEFIEKPTLSFEGANWIYYPLGEPTKDAPTGKRFFRRTIILPSDKPIAGAAIRVTADDQFDAWLNGKKLGASADWKIGAQFDITDRLKPGTNFIAIMTDNKPINAPNPAGLIVALEIHHPDNSVSRIVSGADWVCSTNEAAGWNTASFDDSTWTAPVVEAAYGGGPWGKIDPTKLDQWHGPQSAGIDGSVRVIYVPRPDEVAVKDLDARDDYEASYFDPVTGATTKIGTIHADHDNAWRCEPPANVTHDWVLVLKKNVSL